MSILRKRALISLSKRALISLRNHLRKRATSASPH
jgi:hypothetical protein